MQFPQFWKIFTESKPVTTITPQAGGFNIIRIEDANDGRQSSKVSDINYTFAGRDLVLQPTVPFAQQFEYYTTVGKVQSSIDAYVAEIRTRGYEWEGESTEKAEAWAEEYKLTDLIEYMVRDLLVCGNNIIGITDWKPVQMVNIVGLKRKDDGTVTEYTFARQGRWERLPLSPDQYIHSKFIDINRMPWGIGLFHALTTSFTWNAKDSVPELELYRRHLQNNGVVEEKYAFPRVMYSVDSQVPISTAEMEKIKEQMRGWKPGDRLFIDKPVTMVVETIDGAKSGLLEKTTEIQNEEITAGLQSSVNRLRTQPSAMADAKESNTKDDAMLLYIFSKIEDIINNKIIPLLKVGDVKFKFGQQDDMELNFSELLQIATVSLDNKPIISPKEFRALLVEKGVTLDDGQYEKFMGEVEANAQAQQQHTLDQIAAKQGADAGDQMIAKDDSAEDLRKEAYRKLIKKLDD